MPGGSRLRSISRLAVLLAGLAYVSAAACQWHLQWLLDDPTRENLDRAIRWHPESSLAWSNYANYWLFLDAAKARDGYLHAARLNPMEATNWEGLVNAYQELGDRNNAEAALRASVAAAPGLPQPAWRLANLLLMTGREQEAVPYLRTVADKQREARPAVFDLGWKLGIPAATILSDLVPPSTEGRIDYLYYLIQRGRLAEGYDVWTLVRPSRDPIVQPAGQAYLAALVAAGRSEDAERLWDEMLEDSDRRNAKPAGELLTNGDFEFDISGGPLDWNLLPGNGYEIGLDEFVVRHGSRSLRVVFAGTANPDFLAVFQVVPLKPSREYRFDGYIKTENITTDNGVGFCISSYNAPPAESFQRCSGNHVGDDPWTGEQTDFRTGPNTRFVQVVLRRFRSTKFNNLLRGKVWIDDLSVQPRAAASRP